MDKKACTLKGWGGSTARVLGRCKYCKTFSLADVMLIDKSDGKPYHEQCKKKNDREIADKTHNMIEETNNA